MGRVRVPPLNALRAFEVAARTLNARIAAEEMGVTQGAVAQQIRGLEQHLGLRLFERTPRGLVLTEAGRFYAGSLGYAFDLITEATRVLPTRRRTVTLSVPPSFAAKWLLPRLGSLQTLHPEIDISIVATSTVMSFGRDGIDLCVRYGAGDDGPKSTAPLLQIDLVPVGSPALLASAQATPDEAEVSLLERLPLLHDVQKHHERVVSPSYWQAWFRRSGVIPGREGGTQFSTTGLAIDAAALGLGVALAPIVLVEHDLALGRLAILAREPLRIEWSYHLLLPPHVEPRPEVAAVVEWLRAEARTQRKWQAIQSSVGTT